MALVGSTALSIGRGRTSRGRDRSRGGLGRAGAGTGSGVAVPVRRGVVHALTDSDGSVAVLVDVVEHVSSQVLGGKLMDVVSNDKCVTVRAGLDHAVAEVVLSLLDLLRSKLIVVVSVEIERSDDIAELLHVVHAGLLDASRVRWTHVGWVLADDVADGHLVLDHLVVTLCAGDLVKVLVRPSMTSDLVAILVHLRNCVSPGVGLIDRTFADVVTGNKESGVGATVLKLLHDFFSVYVWAIIVSNGNGLGLQALSNAPTTILNVSKLATVVVLCGSSIWRFVRVTAGTKFELAIRRLAVIRALSAVTLVEISILET